MWIRAIGAVAVIALVALAVLMSVWFAVGAAVVVVAVAAEQFAGPLRAARKGRAPVADVTFAEVLERLGRIRGQLETTSSPEEVLRLEEEAESLAERGREVLERRVGQRVPQRSAHPSVQDDWPPAAQKEQQPAPADNPSWPGTVDDVEGPTQVVQREGGEDGTPTEVVTREQPTEMVTREQSTERVTRSQSTEGVTREQPTEGVADQSGKAPSATESVTREQASEGTPTQVVDLTDAGQATSNAAGNATDDSSKRSHAGSAPADHVSATEQPTQVFRTVD
jgi:hypothetical protein